jgi:hypothetical protein
MRTRLLPLAFVAAVFGTGCGSLAAPVDSWKAQNYTVTMYRLQNYEPPQATAASTTPQGAIPPQLQQWITVGAQMLPPNLIPPGLIPNMGTPAPTSNQPTTRFHGFRVLAFQTVPADVREDIFSLVGKKGNWEAAKGGCGNQFYAEFGFVFSQAGAPATTPTNDVLISLSCAQVQPFNFAWPHGANTGITSDANKKLIDIARRTFGG